MNFLWPLITQSDTFAFDPTGIEPLGRIPGMLEMGSCKYYEICGLEASEAGGEEL